MKDALFGIFDDLWTLQFSSWSELLDIFIKDYRLFYLGLAILFSSIIIYLLSSLLEDTPPLANSKIKEISQVNTHHYYHNPAKNSKLQNITVPNFKSPQLEKPNSELVIDTDSADLDSIKSL